MSIEKTINDLDPDLAKAVAQEQKRQEEHIELIASENYTTRLVMELQGSVLTNKYAEGYPGKRYYGGCEHVDEAETLAIERAKQLFSADYANVQPHSGSQANMAAYMSLLEPGDTILGMSLSDGGHLTHGAKVNFSGKLYRVIAYGLDPNSGEIDYNQVASLAKQHSPKMTVGAYLMVDMAHIAGLVAANCYPNPVPIADVTTSTTHKTLRGPRGGIILAREDQEIQTAINKQVFPGTQGGPLMHVIAAKAHTFLEAMQPEFKDYQRQVIDNAQLMAQSLQGLGYDIVSGGTDCHLFLVDLTKQNIKGSDAETALGKANITLNKNSVPNDTRSPMVTSGLRIGTPAITTRGFGENEIVLLVGMIDSILRNIDDPSSIASVKANVKKLCERFPVYIS